MIKKMFPNSVVAPNPIADKSVAYFTADGKRK
jgi:hypothetical protein